MRGESSPGGRPLNRRDFQLIADTIASFPPDIKRPVARVFAENLAGARGNENFRPDVFLEACGVEELPDESA